MTDKKEPENQSVVEGLDVRSHDPTWRTFQKYRMKKFNGRKLTLPTGVQIPASAFANVRPPGADDSYVLHSVEDYLKQPKPQHRYIWRLRVGPDSDETIGLVESQQIRPVRMDEIKRTPRTSKLFGYTGASSDGKTAATYVGWKRHGLFEIGPDLAYEWYGRPEDWGLAKMANLGQDFVDRVQAHTGGQMEGRFTVKDDKGNTVQEVR